MFYQEFKDNYLYDELLSDGENVRLENVSVAGGADIERGMLLTAGANNLYSQVADTVPATNSFAVAADDFDSGSTVVTAYTSGNFHTDKLKTAGTAKPQDFKEILRRENIILSPLID